MGENVKSGVSLRLDCKQPHLGAKARQESKLALVLQISHFHPGSRRKKIARPTNFHWKYQLWQLRFLWKIVFFLLLLLLLFFFSQQHAGVISTKENTLDFKCLFCFGRLDFNDAGKRAKAFVLLRCLLTNTNVCNASCIKCL